MWTKRLAISLVSCTLAMTAGYASAQSTRGAQHVNSDRLDANATTSNLSIFVFAVRELANVFAVVNVFDFSTGGFTQCVNAEFDLRINKNHSTLSFITEGGLNCLPGQPVAVACEITSQSGVFHHVTNGTAKLPSFDQQFTTHGLIDEYTNMSCVLTALGAVGVPAVGGAISERLHTTP